MIIFAFLFIRLSQYHNLTRGFIRLTRRAWAFFGLKLLFFFYPFVWFFFNFIIQHLISWKLSFVVFSNLVILAKWLRSWVLWINMGWHRSFFSLFFFISSLVFPFFKRCLRRLNIIFFAQRKILSINGRAWTNYLINFFM
jgi:hypothetical protein